jgi:hypothetical protein
MKRPEMADAGMDHAVEHDGAGDAEDRRHRPHGRRSVRARMDGDRGSVPGRTGLGRAEGEGDEGGVQRRREDRDDGTIKR